MLTTLILIVWIQLRGGNFYNVILILLLIATGSIAMKKKRKSFLKGDFELVDSAIPLKDQVPNIIVQYFTVN